MTYIFSGTTEDMMGSVLSDLRIAAEGGPAADAYVRRALLSLVGLYDRQAQSGPADPERLQHFRHESGGEFAKFAFQIRYFVNRTISLAEFSTDDEWYELCMRRSAIQSLIEDYAETPVSGLISPSDVADLDVELGRVGEEQEPIRETLVPKGLPDTHWWWHFLPNKEPEAQSTGTPGLG